MTVATQAERARGAGRAARLLAAAPNAIGVHWFQYADEPPGGRADGEDYNFGLVDIDDRPYEGLVAALRDSDRLARGARSGIIARRPAGRASQVLPRADIDAESESLADWPKAASLVPMTAGPSEVPFGDVHLGLERARPVPGDDRDGLLRARAARAVAEFPRSEAFASRSGSKPAAGRAASRCASCRTQASQMPDRETEAELRRADLPVSEGNSCAAVPGATPAISDGARPAAGDPEGVYPVAPAWVVGTAAPRRPADSSSA